MNEKIDKGTQRDRRADIAGIRFIAIAILLASSPVSIPYISNSISNAIQKANECPIESGQGFHMDRTIAIKFNPDGSFSYSDRLMNIAKTFEGDWEQVGDTIITTNKTSTTGLGIGQENKYYYDCDELTIGGFTLVKDKD